MSTGKWYWELKIVSDSVSNYQNFGVWPGSRAISTYIYETTGVFRVNSPSGAVVDDVFGLAFDAGAGTLQVYRNGTYVGAAYGTPVTISEPWYPVIGDDNSGGGSVLANFGATAFAHSAPAGFLPAYKAIIAGTFSGTVRDATGAFAARKVVASREDTDALVGTATSDATTGAYSIDTMTTGAHTLVFYPAPGESLNAIVRRGVLPIES